MLAERRLLLAHLDHLDHPDNLVLLVCKDFPDNLVTRVKAAAPLLITKAMVVAASAVQQGLQDPLDHLDWTDLQDHQDQMEPQPSPTLLDNQDPQVHRVTLANPDILETPEPLDNLEPQAPALVSSLDHPDLLDLLDPVEPPASLDRAHLHLLWDHLDLPDHLEHLDSLVVTVNPVSLEHLVSQDTTRITALAQPEEAEVIMALLLSLAAATMLTTTLEDMPLPTTAAMLDTASE